jgi:two-component system response regulator HydG
LARQPISGIAPSVIHAMMMYRWKGNVRELENLIKRAIIKTEGPTINSLELPSTVSQPQNEEIVESPQTTMLPYKEYIDHVLRDADQKYLLRILRDSKGNLNQVARLMDIDRKTVYRKIEEYGINVAQFKD